MWLRNPERTQRRRHDMSSESTASNDELPVVEVIDNPVNQQYEAVRGGKVVGLLTYQWTSSSHVGLDHTYVAPRERGHTIGVTLIEHAIAAVRSKSATLSPGCSFVTEYIATHPDHADLVAPSLKPPAGRARRPRFDAAAREAFVHDRHDVQLQPLQIVTSRVLPRQWELEDVDVAYDLFSHPSVTTWMRPVVPPVHARADVAKLLDAWALDSYRAPIPQGRWAIERQDTGEVIGSIFITTPSPASSLLTLWWQVKPGSTGEGFATEAAHAAAHHAFNIGGADHLYALIEPLNERATAVAARLGMRLDGTTSEFYDTTLHRYRLDRDDLEQPQERRSLSLTD
jgi:RimJ/RimL family protein N-acetyltransferase/predicted GNAT family acetyltransferase